MTETKPKRFHRYHPVSETLRWDRRREAASQSDFLHWRERIDARPAGSIAFAPEAK